MKNALIYGILFSIVLTGCTTDNSMNIVADNNGMEQEFVLRTGIFS